jgi:hypothetical protein
MAKRNKMGEILTEDEVREASKYLRDLITSEFPNIPRKHLSMSESIIRLMSLKAQYKEARESLGLSIKEVAVTLKVPQYRLKAVEKGTGHQIKPDIFWKYCDFLDLEDFTKKWIAVNRDLSIELGLISSEDEL